MKKLMDAIPTKAVNHLGLVIDVNLHKKGSNHYIEIDVPANTVPISYHGIYHYRSGSTKQELKGPALHKFLLQKIGVSWEQQIIRSARLDDIDDNTVKRFLRNAINHKRISEHAASSDTLFVLKAFYKTSTNPNKKARIGYRIVIHGFANKEKIPTITTPLRCPSRQIRY